MKLIHALLFLLFTLCYQIVLSELTIPLFLSGYNYNAQISVEENAIANTFNVIIDTGSLTTLFVKESNAAKYNLTASGSPACLSLLEDNYNSILFAGVLQTSPSLVSCPKYRGVITLGSASITENYTTFSNIVNTNTYLYNWATVGGDFGLSYCGNGIDCSLSTFQRLIINAGTTLTEASLYGNSSYLPPITNSSTPLLFGLDFQNATSSSTMQLGSLLPAYATNIVWSPMATSTPQYHMVQMQDLSVCGVNLFSNWSSTWPATIDTGSVCLALPAEIFDSLAAWIDLANVADINDLPTLSFSLSGVASPTTAASHNTYYIPLSTLALSSTTQTDSTIPPLRVSIGGALTPLCVIRGSAILTNDPTGKLNTPGIVLGAMTLKSIYFAADYSVGYVGFSNKLSTSQVSALTASRTHCRARVTCPGQRKFVYNYNNCTDPSCSHYFFTQVNPTTDNCEFSGVSLAFGFLFIVFILLVEVSSYFVFQRTTYDYLIQSDPDDNEDINVTHARMRDASMIDPFTLLVGGVLNKAVDYFLVHVLGYRPRRHLRDD